MKIYPLNDYFNFKLIRKSTILFVLLFFKVSFCYCQKNRFHKEIDSILKWSKKSNELRPLKKAYILSNKYNYTRGKVAAYTFIGDYFLKSRSYDSAYYYLDQAHHIIQKKHKFKRLFKKVVRNKAEIFARRGFYTKALFLYRKAYKISINNNLKDTLLLKLDIFNMFNKLGRYDKTIERLIKLERKFTKDSVRKPFISFKYYTVLAEAYEEKCDFEAALKMRKNNIQRVKTHKNKVLFDQSLLKISELYLLTDNIAKARDILKVFSKRERNLKDKGAELSLFYEINGRLSTRTNNYSLSNKYYDSLIDISLLEPRTLIKAYLYKSDNYKKLSMYKEANESLSLYMQINDSLQRLKDRDILSFYNSDLRYVKKIKETNVLKSENKDQRFSIVILSFILTCISFVIVITLIYRKYSNSKKTIKKLKINEKKIFEDQLKKREEELIVTTDSIQQQNKKIKTIRSNLKFIITDKDYNYLPSVLKELNELLDSSNSINLIYGKLESRYPNLAIILKQNYPELSANDIKHCLLLKLNLSIKDCSRLLNVTDHAIKMARKRIKKKLRLAEEVRLKEFLNDI